MARFLLFSETMNINILSVVTVVFYLSWRSRARGLASRGSYARGQEGNPTGWMFGFAAGMLKGVNFPVGASPYFRGVSMSLPNTYALTALLAALYEGAGVTKLA